MRLALGLAARLDRSDDFRHLPHQRLRLSLEECLSRIAQVFATIYRYYISNRQRITSMSGQPKDEQVSTLTIDGRRVGIYGLYTTGEGTEQPGDDGYDVWLLDDPKDELANAVLLNEGDILYDLPDEQTVRELLADYDQQCSS